MLATAVSIARWLRENQQRDGGICDPMHGDEGTYAASFAGLAFGLMAIDTGDRIWSQAYLRSVSLAHSSGSDFDQLALLLLASAATRQTDASKHVPRPISDWRVPMVRQIDLCNGRRLVSNNWIAMRALNYTLRAELAGSRSDRDTAARLWDKVMGWQLRDGLFVDSPDGVATPITYHAKVCAMLALGLSEAALENAALQSSLRRGLQALARLVSPSGVMVPYGRSRNTLFGYAAGIIALRRGACLLNQPEYFELATRLHDRLRQFQRADGHIPCVLNDGETEREDWDVYVNNPDYNAYAAALLLLAERTKTCHPSTLSAASSADTAHGDAMDPLQPTMDQIGPILTIRLGSMFAAFATEGQTVPFHTPFFSDHRYYGMQPLWIEQNGEALVSPSPYRWRGGADRTGLVDPSANPWIPYLSVAGSRYCVRRYSQVQVRQADMSFHIEAVGEPEVYRPVARWLRGVSALLSPLNKRPVQVFRPHPLAGVHLRRRLSWDAETGVLQATTQVLGSLPTGATLHQPETEVRCR
jgi:hypothetical protein